jgi:hypothetical protein
MPPALIAPLTPRAAAVAPAQRERADDPSYRSVDPPQRRASRAPDYGPWREPYRGDNDIDMESAASPPRGNGPMRSSTDYISARRSVIPDAREEAVQRCLAKAREADIRIHLTWLNGAMYIDDIGDLSQRDLSLFGACFQCGVIYPWHSRSVCQGRGYPPLPTLRRERSKTPFPRYEPREATPVPSASSSRRAVSEVDEEADDEDDTGERWALMRIITKSMARTQRDYDKAVSKAASRSSTARRLGKK